jgi:hypothetical protein
VKRPPDAEGGRNDPCTLGGRINREPVKNMWKTIEADGCTWQVRTVSNPDVGTAAGQSVLEFQPEGGTLPPRRLVVEDSTLEGLDEEGLRKAYLSALPIGGDHYGRPGKRMMDSGE